MANPQGDARSFSMEVGQREFFLIYDNQVLFKTSLATACRSVYWRRAEVCGPIKI
jgi:hypothetical protein